SSLDVDLLAATPAKVKPSVRDAPVDVDVRVLATWGALGITGDAACYVRGATARGTPQQRALLLDLDVTASPEVDANGNLHTTIDIPLLQTHDLAINIDAAPNTDPRCADGIYDGECDDFCGIADGTASIVTGI